MNLDPSIGEMLLRLTLAAALGGVTGWEREQRGKPAGLRTNMMVCLGAASFTLMAVNILRPLPRAIRPESSPAWTTGIGFLGAGAILKSRNGIEGITTAAAIWVVGAVGAACGIGSYPRAIAATLISLAINHALLHAGGGAGTS